MPTDPTSSIRTRPQSGQGLRFLPDWSLPGIILYLTATLFFYLPLSMPFRYPIHRFLDPYKGWTFLFYPETWTILLLLALSVRLVGRQGFWKVLGGDRNFQLLLACAAGYVMVSTLSAIIQGSDPNFVARKLAMEWILPALLGVTLRVLWSDRVDREIQRALILGGLILLGVGIVTYFASFGIPTAFNQHVYSNRTFLIWRGMAGGISFGEIPMGGVNVLAGGVATLLCLVFGALVLAETSRRKSYLLFWILAAAFVEFLCFSRGTLLFVFALPLCFLLAGSEFRRSRWFHAAGGVVFLLLLASTLPHDAYRYWKAQLELREGTSAASRLRQMESALSVERISGREIPDFAFPASNEDAASQEKQGVGSKIGSATPAAGPGHLEAPRAKAKERKKLNAAKRKLARLRQLEATAGIDSPTPENAPPQASLEALSQKIGGPQRRFLIGYGPGHYGLLRGLVADSGTHNIFLNALVECGIGGLTFFMGFFCIAAWRRLLGWRRAADARESVLQLSKLVALLSMVVIGVLVDYRLENLGTMTGAGVLWYLLAAPAGTFSADSSL